jgi:hypothetical protein
MCSAIMELSKTKITNRKQNLSRPSTWEMQQSAYGGDNGIRTRDLLLAKQALYQLSYVPFLSREA